MSRTQYFKLPARGPLSKNITLSPESWRGGTYRRAVRRKANLEVAGEEKPKMRLRRRKANKRLCREKKPVWALPDEEKPVSLVSDEKKISLGRPRAKNCNKRHFAREKNRNLLTKILLILLISRTRNLESIYWQFPVHHRLWISV